MMKPKLDLVSMLLISVNGRSSELDIKKRKAKEGFTSMRLAANTRMLKSDYEFSKQVFHNSLY